jgi:hypothetical protein
MQEQFLPLASARRKNEGPISSRLHRVPHPCLFRPLMTGRFFSEDLSSSKASLYVHPSKNSVNYGCSISETEDFDRGSCSL